MVINLGCCDSFCWLQTFFQQPKIILLKFYINMTPHETAQYMLNQDAFSQWMGIKLVEIREKYCLRQNAPMQGFPAWRQSLQRGRIAAA